MGRPTKVPWSEPRQEVYLDSATLKECAMFANTHELSPNDTLKCLIKMGLGAPPSAALTSTIRSRLRAQIETHWRTRFAEALRQIANESDQLPIWSDT